MSKTCEQCATDDPEADIRLGVCTSCNDKQGGPKRYSLTEQPSSFDSAEELQNYVLHLQEHKASQMTPLTPVGPVKESAPQKVEAKKSRTDVYQQVNFFVRPGDTWSSLLKDAKDEKDLRNSNVLVVAHNHMFEEPCTKKCREIVTKESE